VSQSPRDRKSAASAKREQNSAQSRIPEPFQMVGSATSRRSTSKNVPRLVLEGEWLKAVGFPVGSAAVLTTDRLGEMTLHRLGLSLPRRVRLTAARK
jgi:hypothetical protein